MLMLHSFFILILDKNKVFEIKIASLGIWDRQITFDVIFGLGGN
jgi:hypothetical protein